MAVFETAKQREGVPTAETSNTKGKISFSRTAQEVDAIVRQARGPKKGGFSFWEAVDLFKSNLGILGKSPESYGDMDKPSDDESSRE